MIFFLGLLLFSRNFAKTINDADGHKMGDISNNARFSVLKIAKGSRLLNFGYLCRSAIRHW